MKRLLPFLCLGGALLVVSAGLVRGQGAPSLNTLENDYRNVFSGQGAPIQPAGPPVPTGEQFRSTVGIGGFRTTRLTADGSPARDGTSPLVAGGTSAAEGVTPFARPTSVATSGSSLVVQMDAAIIGSPLSLDYAAIRFGEVIPLPTRDRQGNPFPTGYFLGRPVLTTDSDGRSTDPFYYSPHADKVFATQSGPVKVKWIIAATSTQNPPPTYDQDYLVSPTPVKAVRKIYWTVAPFKGPTVLIPSARVSGVNVVYTANFPDRVATNKVYNPAKPGVPLVDPPAGDTTTPPLEKRTLWYDSADRSIRAYNLEGRVFVEYLGNLQDNANTREHLGFEIVDVIKETRPATMIVNLGETLNPPDGDSRLQPSIAAGLIPSGSEPPYIHQQFSQGGSKSTLYAIRDTAAASLVNGQAQATGNEVLVYWEELGERGIYWPKYLANYVQQWPSTADGGTKYSTYARVPAEGDISVGTAVKLPTDNNPTLVFQSDPTRNHAHLDTSGQFYTNVTATNTEGYSLIRYTSGDDVWFERVWSRLDSTFPDYQALLPATVGDRIEPPTGAEAMIGYINQTAGTAFNVQAYKDPFLFGLEEAAKGAIIPVNALPGKNQLEVWWYRKNRPPSSKFVATAWPQLVRRYALSWPASPAEIVLASNAGSGALPSTQATGTIYTQNDDAKPGYNPNEEHALMLSGRAWALRDDLNLATSSQPHVLLSYLAGDGRPAMRVFKILREKPTADPAVIFNYPATAGTIVQAPMPLPLLPTPPNANVEVVPPTPADPAVNYDADRDRLFRHYQGFTVVDRKGSHWVYRGPHATGTPSFRMRYYYYVQDGFAFPGPGPSVPVGSVVPYLRPYVDPADPTQGFAGDRATGLPLDVVFNPAWPISAPELRVAETLTLPKVGLPAVRGQTSASIIYQQSIARDLAVKQASAVLFDPTRAKTHLLDANLPSLPSSIKSTVLAGKTYFPNLPPHLSERFYFDPSVGTKGALVLVGRFIDAPVGEKYLQLNVLSAKDLSDLKGLVSDFDASATSWKNAVDSLQTKMETFVPDPARAGAFKIDDALTVTKGPRDLAEVTDPDVAVDSYAVSGVGGGSGYVALMTGNGINTDITPAGEPVSVQIFKVAAPLARGELKVIASANPLDEKLTLQHSGDFAGRPEDYDFEWKFLPSGSEPPPPIYKFVADRTLGDGSWTVVRNPDVTWPKYRGPQDAITGPGVSTQTFPSALVVNDGAGEVENGVNRPFVVLRRTFAFDRASFPLRLFLSLDFGTYDGAIVYLNGARLATWNVFEQVNSTPLATLPGADFSPLPQRFEIPPTALRRGAAADTNIITVELYTTADRGTASSVNVRLESALETDTTAVWQSLPSVTGVDLPGVLPGSSQGRVRHVVEGASLQTLSDNYFIMRYRARNATNAAYVENGGWSKWTDIQLAEGWIKRALGGINPFNQRITDLFNNTVDTQVNLISQAGKPFEGDVALNLENINSFGLIEIYETILNRGKGLSIAGTPPVDSPGANNALLLAAGYLSDLNIILGNEAFADAANPTIAFGSDADYGDVTTSLFAFKGQLATVLDEELSLLRGRDDFLTPSVRLAPVYNRLFWNYTRGIDAGEAVYAANYNIRDKNGDGIVNALDAAVIYPQGHGDAYGYYLSALTGFYGLLHNPNFSWTPRTEDVLVAGVPVRVSYQDERKFALAAAAITRSAAQIVDLTYRQAFTAARTNSWAHLRDGRANSGASPYLVRHWGVDEWAARGGQGAYFHWIVGNSLLPAYDVDPNHQGIQKVSRATVPEFAEIVAQSAVIQRSLDNADARLNPLGLSAGALAFDISPSEIDGGRTHYEQIAGRAVTALQNAVSSFDRARDSTRFLRAQSDNADAQALAVAQQEQAYTNQLIDLYGTPYSDDIGVGRTYVQGYAGPDIFHYGYIELPELFLPVGWQNSKSYLLPLKPSFIAFNSSATASPISTDDIVNFGTTKIPYSINDYGQIVKPEGWSGKRVSPGRIQKAVAEGYLARQALSSALEGYDGLRKKMDDKVAVYNSAITLHKDVRDLKISTSVISSAADFAVLVATLGKLTSDLTAEFLKDAKTASFVVVPGVVGLANDLGGPARSAIEASFGASILGVKGASVAEQAFGLLSKSLATNIAAVAALKTDDLNWNYQQAQLITDLKLTLNTLLGGQQAIDSALRRTSDAQQALATLVAEGERIQSERATFRRRAAAVTQGYRTNDFLFRAFRNEALENYRALFDLAAKYTYLAARAYDYETGLLDADGHATADTFYRRIVQARSPGVVTGGVPQFGGSSAGDPGLAGALALMGADWSVAKTRLGFNNPDHYRTTFSLRTERHRLLDNATGDAAWRNILKAGRRDDLLDDPDVKRYALQISDGSGAAVPGIVLEFSTTIQPGQNFFGLPLAGGDHTFSPTSFATKIRASGVAFKGYPGMDAPTTTSGTLGSIGATSPADPAASVADSTALNATPYIYLIPAGADVMSAPPIGGVSLLRSWSVEDEAIPLPFNIGGTSHASDATFIATDSLSESILNLRKHQAFRAVPDGTAFSSQPGFTNARLIGRSVWNTRWKIVIPGNTLLADPQHGLDVFTDTVKDIKLHLESYSYSGN